MRWRDRWAGTLLGAAALVAGVGCVGTIDRDEFEQIIQERGGGFTADQALVAIEAVADRLGVDDVELRNLTLTPSSQTAVLEVRDPATPENLDRYVVIGGEVDSVEPVQLSVSVDLEAETFPASSVAFDRMDRMVDTALAEFGSAGGHVTSLNVSQWTEGPSFLLSMQSPRATATARFTVGGELIEVTPT